MRSLLRTIRQWALVSSFVFSAALLISAQDSGQAQSLGDVARTTRKEHAAAGHIAGKQLVNEEEDGPDTTGIWRERLCTRTPCYELSIALPKDAKWTREKNEPRPVLLPLPGQNQDAERVIRLYNAESLGTTFSPLDGSKRLFLQSWFAKPEYFGQGARISLDEHVQLDGGASGLVSHFTVAGAEIKYRGLSIVAATSNGNYGFACVFRDEDAAVASSICDAIVKSARNQLLEPGKRPVYPGYQPPPVYYYPQHYDPPDDPDDGDPE